MTGIKKLALGLVVTVLACSTAFANSITFQTAAGTNETSGGQPVAAKAVVTTAAGVVTVQLWNLLGLDGNPSISNAGQLLSDFHFTLSSSAASVSYAAGTSGSANLIDVGSGGEATSAGSTAQLGWGLSLGGTTITLDGLGGTATPSNLLLGAACSSGAYCNANRSIASNGPHNPFALNYATFTIDDSAITSATTVSDAIFSFGTASGDNVPGIPSTVPEPPSVLLFASGLLGLAALTRRRVAQGE